MNLVIGATDCGEMPPARKKLTKTKIRTLPCVCGGDVEIVRISGRKAHFSEWIARCLQCDYVGDIKQKQQEAAECHNQYMREMREIKTVAIDETEKFFEV